jgi:hypothetical protein
MPSHFRVPSFLRTRGPSPHLRSFHLLPSPAIKTDPSLQPEILPVTDGGADTCPTHRPLPANLIVPLSGFTLVTIAIVASIFFVISISFAFLGADVEDPYFRITLDKVAESSPGVRTPFISFTWLMCLLPDCFDWRERGRGRGRAFNNYSMVYSGLWSGICAT